jgi:hypothetical protein
MMGPADDGALPPDVQEQVLRARRPLPAAPCARAAPGAGAQRQRPPPPPGARRRPLCAQTHRVRRAAQTLRDAVNAHALAGHMERAYQAAAALLER